MAQQSSMGELALHTNNLLVFRVPKSCAKALARVHCDLLIALVNRRLK